MIWIVAYLVFGGLLHGFMSGITDTDPEPGLLTVVFAWPAVLALFIGQTLGSGLAWLVNRVQR